MISKVKHANGTKVTKCYFFAIILFLYCIFVIIDVLTFTFSTIYMYENFQIHIIIFSTQYADFSLCASFPDVQCQAIF